MTLDDYYNLLYPTLENNKELQLMTEVNINTGVRAGELLGLTISDIKPYEININKQFNCGLRDFSELKTKNRIQCQSQHICTIRYNIISNQNLWTTEVEYSL